MASRLDQISNWNARASLAGFHVALLAEICGVTERQLRRYFRIRFGISPRAWMTDKRMDLARPLLLNGKLVKQAAVEAGFGHHSNFTRRFKNRYNITPVSLRRTPNVRLG